VSFLAVLASVFLFAVPAAASEADLLAERAKTAMRDEQPLLARELALQALDQDPRSDGAWRIYLRSMDAAGLDLISREELRSLADKDAWVAVFWTWWQVVEGDLDVAALEPVAQATPDPGSLALAWVHWTLLDDAGAVALLPDQPDHSLVARLRLRVAVQTGGDLLAARIAREWRRAHPDEPDVLNELWAGRRSGALRRAQKLAWKKTSARLDGGEQDALWLYRALRVFAAAKDHERAKEVVARIEAQGLEGPLHRTAWSGAMREGMGRVLSMKSDDAVLPQGTRSELIDITRHRAERLLTRQDFDGAAAAWAGLRVRVDDADVALEQADLLCLLERWPEALTVALEARLLAARPVEGDLGMLDGATTAVRLADAHGRIAEAAAALGLSALAEEAISVAHGIDPHVRWMALRARAALGAQDDGVGEGLDTLPSDTIVHAVVDTLFEPTSGALWATRAKALVKEGHHEAAYVSSAIARGLGGAAPDLAWRGVGDGMVVEAVIQRQFQTELETAKARRESIRQSRGEVGGVAPPTTGPGLRLPLWQAAQEDGRMLTAQSVTGRPYILTLWASWCEPCLLELPVLNRRAGEPGAPPIVAVSVDEREGAYRRARRQYGLSELQIAWNPDLTTQLGAQALPTTFAIDASGRVVHVERGFSEGSVDRLVQSLAAEVTP
jgi:thiol-disulfide isomerase/thioredoxin